MNQPDPKIGVDEETGLFVVQNQVGDPLFKMKKHKLEEWLDWLENQKQKDKEKDQTN